MHWLFAYGSNMHLYDLERWLATSNLPPGKILQAHAATLVGYRLVWNYYSPVRGGGAANIEPADTLLPGVLLEVDEAALAAIDRKEGHPTRYRRTLADALLGTGGRLRAFTYVAEAPHIRQEYVAPTRHYLGLLLEGARNFALPRAHIEALEALETID